MPPENYRPFIDYSKIDEEYLRQIIEEAENELVDRGEKLFEQLKDNIIKALNEMKEYFPECEMFVYNQCRKCGQDFAVDVLAFDKVDDIDFCR